MRVWRGKPYPLGATWDGSGVNFAIFSENAQQVDLCLFDADAGNEQRIRLFEQTYIGLRPIPVARIVGTAGRRTDFTKSWLPARPEVRDRWVRLEKAFPEGGFPPIVAYEFNGSYYV
ncbi:MAG: hypothetical protein ABR593_01405, partial [Candidatus Limnocylindria bacterium]